MSQHFTSKDKDTGAFTVSLLVGLWCFGGYGYSGSILDVERLKKAGGVEIRVGKVKYSPTVGKPVRNYSEEFEICFENGGKLFKHFEESSIIIRI